MYRKLLKSTTALALATGVAAVGLPAGTYAAEGDFELTIMHTNDTHGNVENFAAKATKVEEIRATNPNNLLLDAGDVFSGTLYFNLFQGEADLALMNELGYDAMVFGNHEFDLGASTEGHAALAEFVGNAEFPLLGANADFSGDELFTDLQTKDVVAGAANGHVYNGVVKEINGEEVGIFGLTTEETASISSPGEIKFTDYIAAAEEAVADFEALGVNKIIALTHIGFDDSSLYDNDKLLGAAVPEIDVIVGGHTHTKLETVVNVGTAEQPTLVVQANEYSKFLGELDVTFNDAGVVTDFNSTLHALGDVEASEAAIATYDAILAPYKAEVDAFKNEEIGATADVDLNGDRGLWGVRAGETNLGNLIADGMLAAAQEVDAETVIAVQNGGGIRTGIEAGPITYGEVLTVMPFGNSLAIAELTGEEVLSILEHAVTEFPKEKGAFLHIAGLSYSFDSTQTAGERVTEAYVWTGDEATAIDPEGTYKVATNTFVAKGGDGFAAFATAYEDGRVSEPGNIDYEMFINYVTSLDTVAPEVEGRIFAEIPFEDVTFENAYFPYVQDVFFQGLVKGTSPTTFEPKTKLTRAQAVSMIVRATGLETEETATFTDISKLADATKAEIAAAEAAGIVKGVDGEFNPNDEVTRAQFALMLQRTYNALTEEDFEDYLLADYSDYGNYSDEAKLAISMVTKLGIASGYEGKFMPGDSTTRAHAAKMMSNFLMYLE